MYSAGDTSGTALSEGGVGLVVPLVVEVQEVEGHLHVARVDVFFRVLVVVLECRRISSWLMVGDWR